MPTNFVQMVLTCGSWQEAQKIADRLLETRLIACAEFVAIKSKYHWKEGLEEADEIKLIMESLHENFAGVEAEVAKLHSYETFVLQAIPLVSLSAAAVNWWQQKTNANSQGATR